MNLAPYSTVNQKNWLLAAMSSNDLALLEPMLKPVALKVKQVLEPANKAIKHGYFITSGLASVIAIGKNSHRLEVGIIGCDGMVLSEIFEFVFFNHSFKLFHHLGIWFVRLGCLGDDWHHLLLSGNKALNLRIC